MIERFESRRDSWIVVVIFASMLLIAVAALDAAQHAADDVARIVPVVMASVTIGFILWLTFGTYYVVGEDRLVIRAGPLRWRIALSDINSVTPTRALWSSPALSLDRLRIEYGSGRWVLVSPERRDAFVAALGLGR